MTTALDMIQDAHEALGTYAPGETITAADAARSLKVLNDMIDSWSNEALSTFAILEQSAPLVVGQLTYTIGVGGNFNMARPIRILNGPGAAYLKDTNNNRYPVRVVPRDQWNTIINLVRTTSNLPNTVFYDPQFPLGIMNVYPVYNGGLGVSLYWDSYLQLVEFANLAQSVSLPPGYVKAIQDSLALQLIPYFKGDTYQPSALLVGRAAESKANVKRSNLRENVAVFDSAFASRRPGMYNGYSDGYRW